MNFQSTHTHYETKDSMTNTCMYAENNYKTSFYKFKRLKQKK